MAVSRAELFFKEIMDAKDPAEFLRALADPTSESFEEEWRDFKCGHGIDPTTHQPVPLEHKQIKHIWSESLSAFANTGGGVLVCGIDCRKIKSPVNPNKYIDVANGLMLVDDPAALKSELNNLHHTATDPGVTGVKIEIVPMAGGGGFVVCLIPESRHKPHSAEYVTGKPFMMRVGDDSVIMPRSVLRTMFFPHITPRLQITVTAGCNNAPMADYKAIIQNIGVATARDLMVVVKERHGYNEAIYTTPDGGFRHVPTVSGMGMVSSVPLHPGQAVPFYASCLRRTDGIFTTYIADFDIYCSDCEPQHASVVFTPEAVRDGVSHTVIAIPVDES